MAEHYDPVRRHEHNRRRTRDRKTIIVTAVVFLVFVGILLSLWWYVSYWKRFERLSSLVSAATTYACDNDCGYADAGFGSYKLKKENVRQLYQCVCAYGPGRERFDMPEGSGITVTYGNDAYIRIVQDAENGRLYFCFFGADGYTHCFFTTQIDSDYLFRQYLSPEKQL